MATITTTTAQQFIPEMWADEMRQHGCTRECRLVHQFRIEHLADQITHVSPDGETTHTRMVDSVALLQAGDWRRAARSLAEAAHGVPPQDDDPVARAIRDRWTYDELANGRRLGT